MAQAFNEINLFSGVDNTIGDYSIIKLQWWHWLIISISVFIVICVILIVIYFCLCKRHIRSCLNNNNENQMYQLVENRRYVDGNKIDTKPIVRQSKSSVSKFSIISDEDSVYKPLTFHSINHV